jgi:hypothetical protein
VHGRGVVHLAQQLEQDDLLLERLQHGAEGLREVQHVPGEVRRPGQRDALLGLVDQRLEDDGHHAREHRPDRRRGGVRQVGQGGRHVDQPGAVQPAAEGLAQPGDLVVGQRAVHLDQPLLDPPGVGDEHQQQPVRGEVHDLEVADRAARQRRVLHDGHLAGQLGQQADRAPDHVVEVDRPLEEGLDGPLLGAGQRLDRRQLVDEQPVALVGRDPAGAGVRVGDVALVLEGCHVVADGGRADPEAVPLGEGLGAHRLRRRHEVLDDRAQDLELAVVQHGSPPLALGLRECQV